MTEVKHYVVSKGPGKLEGSKDLPREWTQLLCSQADYGCGTVFWATKDSGRVVYDDDPRCGGTNDGWQTNCPTCKNSVGGHDVKFIMLVQPPKQ